MYRASLYHVRSSHHKYLRHSADISMNSTPVTSVRRFPLLTNSPANSKYIGNLTSDNYDIISNTLLCAETKWDHLKSDRSTQRRKFAYTQRLDLALLVRCKRINYTKTRRFDGKSVWRKSIPCAYFFQYARLRTRIRTFCLFTYGSTHTEYQNLALFQELFSFVSFRVPVALAVSPSSSPRNSLTAIPNSPFSPKFTVTTHLPIQQKFLENSFEANAGHCIKFERTTRRFSSLPLKFKRGWCSSVDHLSAIELNSIHPLHLLRARFQPLT